MHPLCMSGIHSCCCLSSAIRSSVLPNASRPRIRGGGSAGVQASLKAEEMLNTWRKAQVGQILGGYGDEQRWKHIARKTVQARLSGLHIHQRTSKQAPFGRKERASPVFDEDDSDSEDEDTDILDMAEWIKNKPAGFGDGKVYDTSLEDRLLEEIRLDEQAQATAKAVSQNKIPKPTVKPTKKPGSDVPPDGVEVFLKNLPRKKNVERDMRAALRSVSGLLHVRPLVSGNEKTREPVCKGLAFLTFATPDDAEEFVERYNGESILFGKVEKQIVCELARSSNPYKQISPGQSSAGPRLGVRDPSSGDMVVRSSASSSTFEDAVVVDVGTEVKKPTGNFLSPEVEGDDLKEEDDADLFVLEQEIWNELEDEEDFELDLELEAEDESSEARARSLSGEVDSFTVTNLDDNRHEEDEDETLPHVTGKGFGRSRNVIESGEDGRFSTKKLVGSDEKEKKIRELEAKLEELQSQLNEKNSVESSRANHARVSVGEELRIEALEKRLLRRTKASKDAYVSNGKPSSSTGRPAAKKVQKNSISASEKSSKDKKPKSPPRLKLGASSRLRKKERDIFSEALSKYSAPSRD